MKNFISYICILAFFLTGCAPRLTVEKKSDLQKQLEEMIKTDQIAASHWENEWASYKDSVFTQNKIRVENMFKEYGYLGFDLVGEDGSNNFWLIVQHCDKFPEFQKEVLKAMDKEVKQHNADPNNYAYLYDRVQVNAGQKQKFGTQLDYDVEKTGRAFPKYGLEDSVHVDNIRADYHLGPLKDYLNQMTIMHYEMNKERYEQMGITEPNVY